MDEEQNTPIIIETVIIDEISEDGTRIYTVIVNQEEL